MKKIILPVIVLTMMSCVSKKEFSRVTKQVETLENENKALRDAVVRLDERTNLITNVITGGQQQGAQADQQQQQQITPETVFKQAEQQPSYPGGDKAMFTYFQQNFKWPKGVTFKGELQTQFVVEMDGSLSNFRFDKEIPKELGQEMIRVFTTMPKWNPGLIKGNKVRTLYTLPITI